MSVDLILRDPARFTRGDDDHTWEWNYTHNLKHLQVGLLGRTLAGVLPPTGPVDGLVGAIDTMLSRWYSVPVECWSGFQPPNGWGDIHQFIAELERLLAWIDGSPDPYGIRVSVST